MMKPLKILVVEDEVIIAEDVAGCLRKAGYEVHVANNAGDAISAAKEDMPDLILMDIQLNSDIDGIETARQIKTGADIPVIFLTDLNDKQTADRAQKTGYATYLLKPFNERQILLSIDQALSSASGGAPAEEGSKEPDEYILNDCLFIKMDREGSFKKVDLSDILYIKADRAYCQLRIAGNGSCTLSRSMNQVHAKVGQPSFIQVHRSFVVNLNRVTEVKGNMLVVDDTEIQVGESYKAEVMKKFPMLK